MHEPMLDALRRGAAAEAIVRRPRCRRRQPAGRHRAPAAGRGAAPERRSSRRAGGDRQPRWRWPPTTPTCISNAPACCSTRASSAKPRPRSPAPWDSIPTSSPPTSSRASWPWPAATFDEAERLVKTAARIAPAHPQVAAIEGMVALRRGDADRALAVLSQAAQTRAGRTHAAQRTGLRLHRQGPFRLRRAVLPRPVENAARFASRCAL